MAVTAATMNGLTKKRFGQMNKAIPEFALFQERIKFSERAKLGKEYEELILLTRSQGVTYQKTNKETVYDLEAARSLTTAPATVTAAEIIMVEQIAYGMLAAAERQGEEAYASAIKEALKSIVETHRFRIELAAWYGGSSTGIGVISVHTDGTTTGTLQLTVASWASGIWSQYQNGLIDVYNGSTLRNTTDAIVVTAIDPVTRTLSISGVEADLNAIADGDYIVPHGGYDQQMTGVDAILTNTGSLFGIDAATNLVWKANTFSAGSAPATIFTYGQGLQQAVGRGVMGKRFAIHCAPAAWQDVANDAGGLRRWTESQRAEVEQGTTKLTFYGANNNTLELISNPIIKQGEAMGMVEEDWIRGGPSDLTNGLLGQPTEDFFHEIPGKSGCEVRNFSSQFIMCKKPSHQVKFTNIVPSGAQ
jgi:hypothetical protein